MLTVDNILEWLVKTFDAPCQYGFNGVEVADVMFTNYPDFCCTHCDYEVDAKECWRKYLEAVL